MKWGLIKGIFQGKILSLQEVGSNPRHFSLKERAFPWTAMQLSSLLSPLFSLLPHIKAGLHLPDDGRFVGTKETSLQTPPTMESLVRNATLSLSRRYNYYQVLDKTNSITRSKRRAVTAPISNTQQPSALLNRGSYQYRRERAKKRQIFLQSYNLSFQSRRTHDHHLIGGDEPLSVKLKKTLLKVKSGVVSILRLNAFRSCSRRGSSALCFSSPRPLSRVTPLSSPLH